MSRFSNSIKSALYYFGIFTIVFLLATLALARKVNRYKTVLDTKTFEVRKEVILLTNSVGGTIQDILIEEGEHVKAGQILVKMSDKDLLSKLEILESFSGENLSAKTEAALLLSRKSDYVIRAPRDGVVKDVSIAPGSNVPPNTAILTIYADTGSNVITYLDIKDLADIQKSPTIEIYSSRLEQSFTLEYKGVNQTSKDNNSGDYKAIFVFSDTDSSSYFLDGELLNRAHSSSNEFVRPAEFITNLWNSLIIQSK